MPPSPSPTPHSCLDTEPLVVAIAALSDARAGARDERSLVALIRRLIAFCEDVDRLSPPPSDASGEWQLPAGPIDARAAMIDEVCAIAFAARLELRPLLDRLEGTPRPEDRERARRKVTRIVRALEQATGTAQALENEDVAAALATRRRYTRLRRALGAMSSSVTDASQLECARAHLEILLTCGIALRRLDREEIEALHARVTALRESGGDHASDVARVWQDLVGFGSLLAEVRRRAEVVDHDTAIVARVWPELEDAQVIPPRTRALLDRLFGLDDGLDDLLEARDWSVEPWRARLGALHVRMVRPTTGTFTALGTAW